MDSGVQSFLNYIEYERRYSPHTVASYRNDLDQFCVFLEKEKGNEIQAAQHVEIRNWIVSLMQSNITARSVNRKISTLKSFYKFLMRRGIIRKNPLSKVLNPKTAKRLPVFVEQPGIDKLLNKVEFGEDYNGIRDKMMIELLYGTGIRRNELINLKETDVDFYNAQIKVLGKGNKERIIPVHRNLSDSIKNFMTQKRELIGRQETGYLIVQKNGKQLTTTTVYNGVRKYLDLVTTVDKRSPHTLRHTFATHLLNNGADINAIKELLGHSSLAATQVYTHNSIEKLKNIYKQAHPKA